MPACFSLDLVAGGLGAEREVVDRKSQQTKVITMTSMTAGRAGAAIARPVEIVDRLLQSRRAAVVAGAFGKSCLFSSNVVDGPMVPFAGGRVRIVAEEERGIAFGSVWALWGGLRF
jgi:hypothetical protein